MRNLISFISLAFIALTCLQVQESEQARSVSKNIPSISYAELLLHPDLYNGKVIRVRGSYRAGFEISELYGLDNPDAKDQTWLEFERLGELCADSKKVETSGLPGRITNVLLVGRFYGSDKGYGHLRCYRYKFVVSCVEESEMIITSPSRSTTQPNKALQLTAR